MIRVIRILDGEETEIGTVNSWLSAAALIEGYAKLDRETKEAAFYTASPIYDV